MVIKESTLTKLTITDVPHLDPINVIFEDYGPQRGKVTIEVCGDAWSYFWGAMGEGYTIKSFFVKADSDYIVRKLHIGIQATIDDESQEALELKAKKMILFWRREKSIKKGTARRHWELSEDISDFGKDYNADILNEILGSDWYDMLPQIPNPKYQYLKRIVETIQAAIKNHETAKVF
jgi:hypothetical protein